MICLKTVTVIGWSCKIDTHLCKYFSADRKDKSGNFKWDSLPSDWRHDTHGVRVMYRSAVAQSYQICSVQHLCVITYSPTWFLHYLLTVLSSHHPFILELLMGQQSFVLTGTTASGAGSHSGSGLWSSPVPYSLATCHLLWLELSTDLFSLWTGRRCSAFLRSRVCPQQSTSFHSHVLSVATPSPGEQHTKKPFLRGAQFPGRAQLGFWGFFPHLVLLPPRTWTLGRWWAASKFLESRLLKQSRDPCFISAVLQFKRAKSLFDSKVLQKIFGLF